MKSKLSLVLLFALSLGACQKSAIRPEVEMPTPVVTPSPVVSPTPVPSPKPEQGVKFVPVDYYTTVEERKMIRDAGARAVKLIKSDCAKNFLLARKMIQTEGRTIPEVVSHLQSLSSEVPVEIYYRCMRNWKCPFGTSAVAYRNPPSPTIHLNRAVFWVDPSQMEEWVSVMLHEGYGHSAGEYGHDFNWNAQRDFSVPYSLNAMTSHCYSKVFKD